MFRGGPSESVCVHCELMCILVSFRVWFDELPKWLMPLSPAYWTMLACALTTGPMYGVKRSREFGCALSLLFSLSFVSGFSLLPRQVERPHRARIRKLMRALCMSLAVHFMFFCDVC